jgi:hypothetical protein
MSEINGNNSQHAPLVTVDLRRRTDARSKVLAHADVEIHFGALGVIHIFGFSVFETDSGSLVVLPPAQKGERRSFPHVKLRGSIRELIESAILAEFAKVRVGSAK